MPDKIWITWERQRRSIELAPRLGCQLFVFEDASIFRYPILISKTIWCFLRTKPKIIFVQNPSMILATIACIYGRVTKKIVIVDRHTTFMLDKKLKCTFTDLVFICLNKFTLITADVTIVSNAKLAHIVHEKKGRPFVLPDPLPIIIGKKKRLPEGVNIFMICSFGDDEPVLNVFSAMEDLFDHHKQNAVHLYVSGNYKKLNNNVINKVTKNISFTGFMNDQDYTDMLLSVDAVMALTTASACMLCGCYEAVAAGKPIITSDKDVLKEYFSGNIFVDNSREGISVGITEFINSQSQYIRNAGELRKKIEKEWPGRLSELSSAIAEIKRYKKRQREHCRFKQPNLL